MEQYLSALTIYFRFLSHFRCCGCHTGSERVDKQETDHRLASTDRLRAIEGPALCSRNRQRTSVRLDAA